MIVLPLTLTLRMMLRTMTSHILLTYGDQNVVAHRQVILWGLRVVAAANSLITRTLIEERQDAHLTKSQFPVVQRGLFVAAPITMKNLLNHGKNGKRFAPSGEVLRTNKGNAVVS